MAGLALNLLMDADAPNEDHVRATDLAEQAVELNSEDGALWCVLGATSACAGQWKNPWRLFAARLAWRL